jgi:hypothetical protein
MNSYEEWTRSEVTRLKAEAERALAEADVLQRNFDKWRESQGHKSESKPTKKTEENHSLNGHGTRRTKRGAYGNKNATALEKIKASPSGLTTDDLFSVFSELYGPKYKRSSLRALLFHQKGLGNIEKHGERYVIAQKASQ